MSERELSPSALKEMLERGAPEVSVTYEDATIRTSIAISLKRIADAMTKGAASLTDLFDSVENIRALIDRAQR